MTTAEDSKTVRIDGKLFARLDVFCRQTGITRRRVIDDAVRQHLRNDEQPAELPIAAEDDVQYGRTP